MSSLRVTIVSTFYPNESDPYRAVFVRNLAVAMARRGARIEVIAPVPYAPPWPPKPGWRALRAIRASETRDGIRIDHPRFLVIPRLDSAAGFTYARGIARCLRNIATQSATDVVHVHCAYPDGAAVARLAREHRLPFVITAHGSDINVYAERPRIATQVGAALQRADAVVAVSEALRKKVLALAPTRSHCITRIPCCGFEPVVFHPGDRSVARSAQGLPPAGKVVVFVGQLVPIKALDDLVSAWSMGLEGCWLGPDDRLVLIGDGPLRARLEAQAASSACRGTVILPGSMSQPRIAEYLRAANALCLPSLNEGLPNVVVEAFASGLPVVATDVGGLKELVLPAVNGFLVPASRPEALADALHRALVVEWDTDQIVESVRDYTWDHLADKNIGVLSAVARGEPLPVDM